MRPPQWLASVLTVLGLSGRQADEEKPPTAEPPLDVAEEFQKLHRGLRRLSLASDRSGEILQAVSLRLDEMQQRLLQMSRPPRSGVSLEEGALLTVLDRLDHAASAAELPRSVGALIDSARGALLQAAGWQPVAVAGAQPDGADIRIAEMAGEPAARVQDTRIHRILEQGYRRADGSLLRPGVVIAAAAGHASQNALS